MAQIAFAAAAAVAVSAISQSLSRHKPSLADLMITSSAYGDSIPIVYGTARLGTRIIWSDGLKTVHSNKKGKFSANGTGATTGGKKGKSGGKFGKSGDGSTVYTANLAYGICEGPISELLTIWANGTVIYDITGTYKNQKGEYVNEGDYRFSFYNGTQSSADPMIQDWTETNYGVGSTPAYKDWAYITFEDLDLTAWGGSIPELHCQVVRNATPAYPSTDWTLQNNTFSALSSYTARVDWSTRNIYVLTGSLFATLNIDSLTQTNVYDYPTADLGGGFGIVPGKYLGIGTQFNGFANGVYLPGQIGIADLNNPADLQPVLLPETYAEPFQVLGYSDNGQATFLMASFSNKLWIYKVGQPPVKLGSLPAGTTQLGMMAYQPSGGGSAEVYAAPIQTTSTTFDLFVMVPDEMLGAVTLSGQIPVIPQTASFSINKLLNVPSGQTYQTPLNLQMLEIDQVDGGLIVAFTDGARNLCVIFKWISSEGIVWQRNDLQLGIFGDCSLGNCWINNQKLGLVGTGLNTYGYYYVISTVTGATIWSTIKGNFAQNADATNFIAYDGLTNSLIVHGDDYTYSTVYLQRQTSQTETLGYICSDVSLRCGLSVPQIDVSKLTQQVSGYAFSKRGAGKEAITQLAGVYFFDAVESDYILKFVPRGQAPLWSITQGDLGETKNSSGTSTKDDNYWKQTRKQETELPVQVEFGYFDAGLAFQRNVQYAKRTQAPAAATNAHIYQNTSAPIIMSANEAAQVAEKQLWTQWLERDEYGCTLGWKYLLLDPTDVATVTLNDGSVFTVRSDKTDFGGDYSVPVAFTAENTTAYQSTAVGGTGTLFVSAMSVITVTTQALAYDLPYLSDYDEEGSNVAIVYYGAGVIYTSQWLGAVMGRTLNGDQEDILGGAAPLFWGTLAAPLPPTSNPFMIDDSYTITVFPYQGSVGSLISANMNDFLNGANMAIVAGEIIQFLTAVANTNGSYTLSGILRGMRGTVYLCDYHQQNEVFILANRALLGQDDYQYPEVGDTAAYQVEAPGNNITAFRTSITLQGNALRPYSPCQIQATSDGNGGTTISWTRCTRLFGGLQENSGTVPLNEVSEAYTIFILGQPYSPSSFSPTNPSSFLRTVTGLTSPSFDYTQAMQASDNQSTGGTLYVVVYQVSATVGLGFPGFMTLPGAAA